MKKNRMSPDGIQKAFDIVADYGKVLVQSAQLPIASPESWLSHSKDTIRTAIKLALLVTEDKTTIGHLVNGYISLADFIPDHEAHLLNAYWEELQYFVKDREYMKNKGAVRLDEALKIWEKIKKDSEVLEADINEIIRATNK